MVMKAICVFSGANAGFQPIYSEAALELGRNIARRGLKLIFGGGGVGLMGVVADAALAVGGEVIGVIPRALVTKELAHRKVTDMRVVGSMHERKALMAELADGFIALPGGYGTLDELCEILTWAQLGIHAKPSALLNVADYFDPFLAFLDHSVREGFIRSEHRAMLFVAQDSEVLLEAMKTYQAPVTPKWLDLQQT